MMSRTFSGDAGEGGSDLIAAGCNKCETGNGALGV